MYCIEAKDVFKDITRENIDGVFRVSFRLIAINWALKEFDCNYCIKQND